MSDRYKHLFSLPSMLYQEGAPVIIEAGALLEDTKNQSVLAQLKFKSLSDKSIKAINVQVQPLDVTGKATGGVVTHQYLDLKVGRDDEFGQKEAVRLPDNTTRQFRVFVDEVVFEDTEVWHSNGKSWMSLESPKSLKELFDDPELIKQYKLDYGEQSAVFPIKKADLWFCSCGAINHNDEMNCHHCGNEKEKLFDFDADKINEEKSTRLNDETYDKASSLLAENRIESVENAKELFEKIEDWKDSKQKADEAGHKLSQLKQQAKENKANQAKRKKKQSIIISVVIVVLIIAGIAIYFIPRSIKYNDAISNMNSGKYAEAITEFQSLKTYKDSNDKLAEAIYKNANTLLEKEKFDDAINELKELDNLGSNKYKDAKQLENYASALSKFSKGDYKTAYNELKKLNGYKKSNEYLAKIIKSVSSIEKYVSRTDGTYVPHNYQITYRDDHRIESISEAESSEGYEIQYDDNGKWIGYVSKYLTSSTQNTITYNADGSFSISYQTDHSNGSSSFDQFGNMLSKASSYSDKYTNGSGQTNYSDLTLNDRNNPTSYTSNYVSQTSDDRNYSSSFDYYYQYDDDQDLLQVNESHNRFDNKSQDEFTKFNYSYESGTSSDDVKNNNNLILKVLLWY